MTGAGFGTPFGIWGGCFKRVIQPLFAKIDKFQNKHSCFILFPAFIERSRTFSDSRVLPELSHGHEKCDQKTTDHVVIKETETNLPNFEGCCDVVVISVLFARWYVYFRCLKCRDLYASLWKISVYFRKLMVFEVPVFLETHSEVLRYRYMIVCLELYIYLCILDSFAYIYIYTYMRSSSDCPMIFCSSPFNSFVQGIFQRSLNYPFWRNQAMQLCGNFEGFPL